MKDVIASVTLYRVWSVYGCCLFSQNKNFMILAGKNAFIQSGISLLQAPETLTTTKRRSVAAFLHQRRISVALNKIPYSI